MRRMEYERQIEELERRIQHGGLGPGDRLKALHALKAAYSAVGQRRLACGAADSVIEEGTAWASEAEGRRDRADALEMVRRAHVTKAPDDFHSYLVALEWGRDPDKRFYLPRVRTMRPIADIWTDMFANDAYDLLLFSMPPGTGKSTLGIFGCSWVGWRDPERCNLMSGYADKIVHGFYNELNSIFTDPDYDTRGIFPRLEVVSQSAKDYTIDFTDTGRITGKRFPTFTCRSIDGSLTGATRCENLLYCDDLVEGIEEALNPARLDTLWSKYANDLASRKKDGCKEVHIGTRWSVRDPIGRLEDMYGYSERTRIVKVPALDGRGESNFDYDYGVGFSTAYFERQREKLDPVSWGSLYQQEPVERDGLLFPEDELGRFYPFDGEFLSSNPPDDLFAFVDVAFGGFDYLSMPIIARWGDDSYVVDWVFMKGDYKATEPVVAGAILKWGVRRVTFEANNGGDFYSRDVDKMLREEPGAPSVFVTAQRAPANTSKMSRIQQHSPVILSMRFLHESCYPADGMYRAAMANLTRFTQTGKNQNDDAPDSLAGAATMIRTAGAAKVAAMGSRPIGL